MKVAAATAAGTAPGPGRRPDAASMAGRRARCAAERADHESHLAKHPSSGAESDFSSSSSLPWS